MGFGPLVQSGWLEERLGDPTLRIFDTTVLLTPSPEGAERPYRLESGATTYRARHLPGAGFLDLTRELSRPDTSVPFQMPEPAALADVLARAGVGSDAQVVLYSRRSMMWSTRVWWMLRAIGFEAAAVLDGGFEKWVAEGRPSTDVPCAYEPCSRAARFVARPRPELLADKKETTAAMDRGGTCTLNALSPEVYAGTVPRHYGRPGHIPGSYNVYYDHLLDPETGTFLPPAELRERFVASGALAAERVVTYCGGGISATMPALALTLLGHPSVAVYDGSLWEWAADPALPLTTGPRP